MPRQDKIILGILFFQSVWGVLSTLLLAPQSANPALFVDLNLVIACVGMIVALSWWKRNPWAHAIAMVFYGIQAVHVFTPAFKWSVTLGINAIVLFKLHNGETYGINFFALVMLFWVAVRLHAADSHIPSVR